MTNLIKKYTKQIRLTTRALNMNEYKFNKGYITNEEYRRLSLSYSVELSIYNDFIKDLQSLNS
jgi:hypothetical protein